MTNSYTVSSLFGFSFLMVMNKSYKMFDIMAFMNNSDKIVDIVTFMNSALFFYYN
jgi:hypothetical protein